MKNDVQFAAEEIQPLWEEVLEIPKPKPLSDWVKQAGESHWNNWIGWKAPAPLKPEGMKDDEYQDRLAVCAALLTVAALGREQEKSGEQEQNNRPTVTDIAALKKNIPLLENQLEMFIREATVLCERQKRIEELLSSLPFVVSSTIVGNAQVGEQSSNYQGWQTNGGLRIDLPLDYLQSILQQTQVFKTKLPEYQLMAKRALSTKVQPPDSAFVRICTANLSLAVHALDMLKQAGISIPTTKPEFDSGYSARIVDKLLKLAKLPGSGEHLVRDARQLLDATYNNQDSCN